MQVARLSAETVPWHGMKDRYAFALVERGEFEWQHRGFTHRGAAGDVALIEPGRIYREVRRSRRAEVVAVLFPGREMEAALRASDARGQRVQGTPRLSPTDPRAAPLSRLHLRLRRGRAADLQQDCLVADAALALAQLTGGRASPEAREPSAVRRAREYLLDHLREPVRLDDLAEHAGLDKYHLVRAFRAEMGVPPYRYLTHARITRARRLLEAGWSAGRTAVQVGYCDQSQLHRHFVRIVGTTPGRYAQLAERGAPSGPLSRASRRTGGA